MGETFIFHSDINDINDMTIDVWLRSQKKMEPDYKMFLYSIKTRAFFVFAFISEISDCGNENGVFSNEYLLYINDGLFIHREAMPCKSISGCSLIIGRCYP